MIMGIEISYISSLFNSGWNGTSIKCPHQNFTRYDQTKLMLHGSITIYIIHVSQNKIFTYVYSMKKHFQEVDCFIKTTILSVIRSTEACFLFLMTQHVVIYEKKNQYHDCIWLYIYIYLYWFFIIIANFHLVLWWRVKTTYIGCKSISSMFDSIQHPCFTITVYIVVKNETVYEPMWRCDANCNRNQFCTCYNISPR